MNCSFGHSLNHVINTTFVFMVLYVFHHVKLAVH